MDVREITAGLSAIVGSAHVLVDDDLRAGYERDWTGRYCGRCAAVVRPGDTAETAAVLAWCAAHGVAVVPQGGNTGLVGGGVPRPDPSPSSVVLSLRRLGAVGAVDTDAMQVTTGAGVTLTRWQAHARSAGLDAPVDFAARDSATIGGAIATNAGGSRVVRFGTMRSHVAGIEAVLVDGTLVGSLTGLPKETAGLHWPSLLAGSEGTLAVVTRARLRLVPWYRRTATAMLAVPDLATAVEVLGTARPALASLDSFELVHAAALSVVADHLGRPAPVAVPTDGAALIVECADHADPTDSLVAALAVCDGITDTAVATEPTRRAHLVEFRDRLTEAIAAAAARTGSPVFKLDVAVPVDRLDELLAAASDAAGADGAELLAFGHLAEGNLHLNHLGARSPERIAERVLAVVADLGGTVSAEHGIGIAKARWLPLVRSPGDLAAQAAIRRALDPSGLMNPGVLAPS